MAVRITDQATDRLVRLLAEKKGKTIEETVREAIEYQLERELQRMPSSRLYWLMLKRLCANPVDHRNAGKIVGRFSTPGGA